MDIFIGIQICTCLPPKENMNLHYCLILFALCQLVLTEGLLVPTHSWQVDICNKLTSINYELKYHLYFINK